MNCYAVFSKNKQLRVFAYSILNLTDWVRASDLAFEFAKRMHAAGYPCTVERFHMCDVGTTVLNTGE
jgi:hypothetical protein